MKILHLGKFYPPSTGGLENVVACQAEGAARAGHEVTVVCGRGPDEAGRGATEETLNGVRVRRLATPLILWSQPIVRGYVAAARQPADVVHVHHPHPLADVALLASAPRPTVLTHHADIRRQRLVMPLVAPLVKRALRRVSAIAVPTRSHIAISDELKGFEHKCRVIPFGVDEHRFAPRPPGDSLRCFRGFGDRPVGVWVGRLVGYKGLDVLLEAVAGTELAVVLVGTGPLEQELSDQVAARRLAGNIAFAGAVPDEGLPGCYNAADYFVFPSTTPQEMFGISLVEALASGLPVITTALPTGVREVTAPGEVGLEVAPGDAAALRSAMLQMHGDPELRRRMGAAARARALARFTLSGMVRAHLDLYESLVDRPVGDSTTPRT